MYAEHAVVTYGNSYHSSSPHKYPTLISNIANSLICELMEGSKYK